MMRFVFDSSAALAILFDEARGAGLGELIEEGCIGSVNLGEAVTVMARRGGDPRAICSGVAELPLFVVNLTSALAIEAGLLWPLTKSHGSSLGDRCALALTQRLDATLLTSDQRLVDASRVLGVSVRFLEGPGAASDK